MLLKEGMVIAIEPMINVGCKNITQHNDGWTITTLDNKPSAHFEHTVVVRKIKRFYQVCRNRKNNKWQSKLI